MKSHESSWQPLESLEARLMLSGDAPVIGFVDTPYAITEGDAVTFDATGSTDNESDDLTYSWDLNNDGTYGDSAEANPTFSWAQLVAAGIDDDGSYTIGLELSDGTSTVTDTTTLTVANAIPTIALTGDANVNENTAYTLTLGAVTDPGDDTPTSYIVDWGDGTDWNYYGTAGDKSHTFADDGSFTITVSVWDEDGIHTAGTLGVTVDNVAPSVISGTTETLSAINEDIADGSNTGATVNALFLVHYSDTADDFAGVAIVGNTADAVTEGAWQYSTDGGTTWTAVDAGVDATTAIVLDTAAKVRFAPVANYHGTPGGLSVRLWDGSGELNAGSANDVSGTIGGTGALSADAVTLGTTVNSVNDTPTFTSAAVTDATEDAAYTYNITTNDADGDAVAITGLTVPGWLTFTDNGDGTATLTGTPTNDEVGDHDVSLQVSDGSVATQSFTVTVTNTNDAPTVATPLVDQNATEDVPFSYQFAADAFTDVDVGDTLAYTATLDDDSPLPGWLSFDAGTRTFSGTPTNDDTGTVNVKVTASDGIAAISDTFALDVAAVNDAPVITAPAAQTVDEDNTLTFSTANGNVVSIADVDLGANELEVTLTVTDGTLTLAQTTNLTITGGADGSATVTFTGAETDVNAALDGMSYAPTADYNGGATLTVEVSDQGATGSGGVLTDDVIVPITVTAVDDAPVINLDADDSGGVSPDFAGTFDENGAAIDIADADAVLTDVDSDDLASLTVTITNVVAGDTLDADVSGTSIVKDYNAGTGVLTLSGADSVANYEAVLQTVIYTSSSDDPTDTARVITFVANDGTSDSAAATTTVTVNVSNDSPTLATNAGLTLDEGAADTITDAMLEVTDPDNTAAQITYTVTAVPTHGALKLDGTTLANDDTFTQADIDSGLVTYVHDDSETTSDEFTITVADGAGGTIGATTFDITITAQNDDPVLSVSGSAVDDTVAVDDVAEEDTFTFEAANSNAITVADADAVADLSMSLAATKGTLTLGGTAGLTNLAGDGTATVSFDGTAAEINAALEGLTYAADGDAEGAETITLTINDNGSEGAGGGADIVRTITFNITPVNDAPVLDNTDPWVVTGIDEDPATNEGMLVSDLIATGTGGDPISDVDEGAVDGVAVIGVDDANGTWEYSTDGGATWIAFGGVGAGSAVLLGAGPNDRVRFVPDANYNGSATLTLRAWDTSDANTSGTTGIDTTTNGDDTAFSTATVTGQITVAAVNDAPVVDLDPDNSGGSQPDYAIDWTEGDGPLVIVDAADAAVTDVDSANLASMTVTITNFVSGDVLDADVGVTGITKDYNADTGVLSLTGSTTKANYQDVLRTLTFNSTSEDPDTTARTITIVANDGAADSTAVTATVNMTAVNDVPVVDLDEDDSGGASPDFTSSYTENAAATSIVDDVAVSDVDDATLASMTITITNLVSGDIIDADVNGTSIAKSYNSGTLSLTGVDTVANYQAVLQTLTFASISNNPTDTARTITIVANDGTGDSAAATATVNVTPTNDLPTLSGADGTSVDYTEGDPATAILPAIAITDPDDTNIESATITISNNLVSGDVLDATVGDTGIVADYTAGTGTLALTGSAAKSDYQDVLRTVTFVHTGDDPTDAVRTITVVVNDGDGDSDASAMTVNVTPVNDAAVIDLDASNTSGEQPNFAATWGEDDAPVSIAAGDAAITDADNTNLASMTVSITANFVAGDTLAADVTGTSITDSYDSNTGVLTLSGADTVANYEAVLQTLTFASTSDNPTDAQRTVTIVVNDGTADSIARTTAVTVTPVNDVPTLDGADGTDVDYTEGDPATAILPAITLTDPDDTNIESATIVITNVVSGDVLDATVGATGLIADYTAGTGTLTLTGSATLATYQDVLRTVTFVHTGDDPTDAARSITVVINDGDGDSAASTVTVNVTPVNDAPTISLDEDGSGGDAPNFAVTYTENDGAVTIVDTDAVIDDSDDTNIESMTVTITNVVNGDVLDADVGATGLDKSWSAGTGTLTLTGSASVADYQSVLQTVSYASTSDAPTGVARTVTFVVNDGDADSAVATATVNVQNVNDDPTMTVPGAQAVDEDASLTLSSGGGNAISIGDVDAATSDVTVTLEVTNGTLALSDGSGLTDVTGDGTATVVLTGTVTAINTALAAGVVYAPTEHWNGAETLTTTVNDGGNTGSGGGDDVIETVDITVNAVNDDPSITVPAAQNVDEDGSLVFSTANSNAVSVADVDSDAGDLTVTLAVTNGTLTLADPGAVTITGGADGTNTVTFTGTVAAVNTAIATITYTPTGDYNGADTLTVTVNDGGNTGSGGGGDVIETVDITVNAVNDDPTVTVPGAQAVDEDAVLTFSDGGGNGVSIADVDAAAGDVQVTLAVSNGTLTMADTTGVTASGDGTATVTLAGTVANINTALDAGFDYAASEHYNGGDTLTVTVNDQGNTGSGGGGDVSDTVAITVNALNDDPTIAVPAAQSVDEDGSLVFSTANGNAIVITDVDSDAGDLTVTLAVTSGTVTLADAQPVTITGGADGTDTVTFTGTVAAVSTAIATITYAPNDDYNGADTLTVTVNDGGNTGSGGGGDVVETVDITVNAVNDAPTISVDGTLVADTVAVDDVAEEATFTFEAANANAITVAEIDATSTDHSISLTATKGTLTLGDTTDLANLVGDGTAAVSFDGTIAEINNALDGLSYAGDTDAEGAETLTLTLSDNGNTGSGGVQEISRTITFTLTPVNDAPVLDNGTDMTVTGVNEDVQTIDNPGMTIAELLATGAGGNPITDVDADAVEGVAITAVDDTNGTWQFSTNGGASWTAFGPVSDATAVVLTATANDKIRFRPNNNFNGTATVTFRAWDTTDGDASGTPGADTTVNGGSTAFSTATATAQITVANVNDAPTMDNSVIMTLAAVDEDVLDADNAGMGVSDLLATGAGGDPISDIDSGAVDGIAVTSADNTNGTWQYSTDAGTTWTAFGSVDDFGAVVLDAAARIRFVPNADYNGTADITFRAWDTTDGNASGTAEVAVFSNGGTTAYSTATAFGRITVNALNDAPIVDAGIADQTATEDAAFEFTVPADAFADVDADDTLTYAATLADDSPLPAWLAFDAGTRTFSGTPENGDVGTISVKVTATDGSEASISDTFDLTVANTNDAPTVANAIVDQAATEDEAFSFIVPADTFADVDADDTLTYAATLADDSPLPAWLGFDAGTRTFSGTPENGDVGTIAVKVTATDSGDATASSSFDLTVANTNDSPTMDDLAVDMPEDAADGAVLGSLAATDVDAGDELTYTIVSGNDAGRFALDSATGEITLADATGVDFETTTSYTFDVRVEDAAGATADATVTVNVTNVNEAPTAADATVYVPITAETGDPVVDVVAADVDAGDSLTYAITGGDDGGAFAIDEATGAITVADPAALAAGPEVYTLDVTVTDDGGETAVATITVNVAEAYLQPSFDGVTLPDTVVQGNSLATRVVLTNTGVARATDPVTLQYAAVPVGGGDAIVLKTSEDMGTFIAAGGIRTYIESIELPANAVLPAGDYTLKVTAQVGDIVTEAADDTLITVEQAVVTLTPDVTSVSLADAVLAGATGVVSIRVTNDGNITAAAPMTLGLYLSADGTYDAGDAALAAEQTLITGIAPGAGQTVNIPVTVPAIAALSAGEGAYQVLVVCESAGETTEAVAESPVTVAAPFVDLTAEILRASLPEGSIVPGDRGAVLVTVSNLGNIRATGGVIATLYASQTGDVDGTAVQLADPVTTNVNLAPSGGAANLAFRGVTIPETLQVDTDYHLVVEVEVDPDGGMDAEDVERLDNNIGASDAADARTFEMWFGTYGDRRNVVLKLTDPDTSELVFFRMAQGGAGQVSYDGAYDIEVTGTTSASSVVVQTTGGAEVDLGDVTVPVDAGSGENVDLGGILAGGANLTGDLTVSGGLRQLILNDIDGGAEQAITIGATALPYAGDVLRMIAGNVVDASLESLTPIQAMVISAWIDSDDAVGFADGLAQPGTNDAITAPWLNVLRTDGAFQADLTLEPMIGLPDRSPAARGGFELGNARIGGQLTGAVWTIETAAGNMVLGGADQWTLTAPSAGTIIVRGDVTDSTVTLDGELDRRSFGLRRLSVFGALDGSGIRTVGNVGVVDLGRMVDSALFAGVNDGVTTLPQAGDFTAADPIHGQATLHRFVINQPGLTARRGFAAEGDLFVNSGVAAGRIRRAVVRDVETSNDDHGNATLGFAADSSIDLLVWLDSATGREGIFRGTEWTLGGDTDDFVVRVV